MILRRSIIRWVVLLSCFSTGFASAQSFIENKGQLRDQFGALNSEVKFYTAYGAFRVFLKTDGFSYELIRLKSDTLRQNTSIDVDFNRIDVRFLNHSFDGEIEHDEVVTHEKFYRGAESYESVSYSQVIYKNVYPNIDVVFYAGEKGFKYDFILHPKADLSVIRMSFDSPFETKLIDGAIQSTAPLGTLSEHIPHSFFQGSQEKIEIQYIEIDTEENGRIFKFSAPNQVTHFDKTLVIDPMPNIWFGTYISGNLDEFAQKVALDEAGGIYVVGYTNSVINIATSGTFQGTLQGVYDVFLVKYKPNGTKLWGTYVGGNSFDRSYGLAYKNGYLYFCGNSFSQNFATVGVHQTTNMNADDAFLAKFDTLGNRVWCTYYGGEAHDFASSVVVNDNDQVYITGHTLSYTNIATAGVHMESFLGISASFLAKFSSVGQLIWGTYYGSSFDEGYGIALDSNDNIVFSGFSSSSSGLASPGAQQMNNAGGVDAFLVKFTPNGSRIWGTFFGGPGDDKAYDLCIDAADNIYMVGGTSSLTGISSGSGFQLQAGSIDDGFVAKYSPNGNRLWSTYVGGSEAEYLNAVAMYFEQGIIIGGKTQSQNNIATSSALSSNLSGQYDALIMRLSPSGSLQWGSYFGGTSNDEFTGVAIDASNGYIHASGVTLSSNGIATPNADQTSPGTTGLFHGFLARFCAPYVPNFITAIDPVSCGSSNYSIEVDPFDAFVDFEWHDSSNAPVFSFENLTAGEYFYFLTTTDTNNCSFTTDTFFFQVLPDVQIELDILHDPMIFCSGSEATFFTIENFADYEWSNGSQNAQLNLILDALGQQYVALTVANENGCLAVDTLYFVVLEAPEPEIELSGSTNFCLGEIAYANTSVPFSSYVWNTDDLTAQTDISSDSWILVTVTNSSGCSGTSDSIFVSSTELLPSISMLNDPPFCPNTTLNFGLNNSFNFYEWSTGQITSTASSTGVPGEQWMAVEVGNLCGGSGTDTLFYLVFPEIDFSIDANIPSLLCVGSEVQAGVSSDFSEVLWQNANLGSSYSELATAFGTWSIVVEALDENACPVFDTLILEVDSCTLNLETLDHAFEVYPNPASDELYVQNEFLRIGVIELTDGQGRIIERIEVDKPLISMNLQPFSAGSYLIKFYDASGKILSVKRFLKSTD